MSRRLRLAAAIPLLGLLLLLGALAFLARETGSLEYRGREYTTPRRVESTAGFAATDDRVGGRQVLVPLRQLPGPPPRILLRDADGELTEYRLAR